MPLQVSRPISHSVQSQTYKIDLETKILFNPGNKLLKKSQESLEYQGIVSISVSDNKIVKSDFLCEGENYFDLINRVSKIAVLSLMDKLFPSDKLKEIAIIDLKKKK